MTKEAADLSFGFLSAYYKGISNHGEDNEYPKQRLHSQVSGNSQLRSRAANPPWCLITSSKPPPGCYGWVRALEMHFKVFMSVEPPLWGNLEPESCKSVTGCAWGLSHPLSYCCVCNARCEKLARLPSRKQWEEVCPS